MPRKSKNAPPPEWLAPLQEWVREVRFALMSNRHFDDAEALRLLMRDRGDEIARLMRASGRGMCQLRCRAPMPHARRSNDRRSIASSCCFLPAGRTEATGDSRRFAGR